MVSDKLSLELFNKISSQIPKATVIKFDELPHYDLFLSQVIDFLNVKLDTDEFTSNIVQNYIKNEVISKPEEGKKKGYTKMHLIQLILVSYMRPVLTTDEIKKVLRLAFNEINNHQDDIISWELAYKVFTSSQNEALADFKYANYLSDEALNAELTEFNLNDQEKERIRVFLSVMKLIAEASTIKKTVQNIVDEFGDSLIE
jgi:hypothetical protein